MNRARFPYGGCRETAAPAPGVPPGVAALAVRDLHVRYPGAADWALQGVNLELARGQRLALAGPNGSGKSTLLKAVAGLLPAAQGEIAILGGAIQYRRTRLAYLAQRADLDWRFPICVRQLVMTGRYVHLGWLRRPSRDDRRIVEEVLQRLGIADLAQEPIGQLSGGQQQRALLARALAQEADLLLLDEPANAVDTATRAVLAELMNDLQHQGKAFVVATHELDHLEQPYDTVVYLHDGRCVPAPVHHHDHPDPPINRTRHAHAD